MIVFKSGTYCNRRWPYCDVCSWSLFCCHFDCSHNCDTTGEELSFTLTNFILLKVVEGLYKHKKSKLRFSSFVQGSQIRQIWRILLQNCSDDSTEVAEGVDMNVHWHYRSWISGGWCLQSGCFFARNIACTWIAVLRLAIASQFDISPFAFCEKWLCT